MKSAEGRLDKCEQALGMSAAGLCDCPGPAYDWRVYHEGEPEPDATLSVCPECGRERRLVVWRIVADR